MRYLHYPLAILVICLIPLSADAATRSLVVGTSGDDVRQVQATLIERGYLTPGNATGYFGPLTLAAVRKFQCAAGIICQGAAYGTVGPATRAALGASSLEIMGWIPYWRAATGTADVLPHLASLTSVMPFGYVVQPDGSLHDAFGLDAPRSTTSATLVAAAHAQGVKVVPTVMWSDTEAIHRILSDQTSRIALEDAIADLAKKNGFDGISIDFEGKYAKTIDYFSTFLKGLYQRMGNKWVYCAIEARTPVERRYDGTPPPDATVYANDFEAINKYCDRVQLMTYDQQTVDVSLNRTADGAPYIPVADPRWVESVVELAAKSIAKNKLMIGIATYGYEWEVSPLAVSGYRYDKLWAFNPRYATDLATQLSVTPTRNAAGELSFTYKPDAEGGPAAVSVAASGEATETTSGTGNQTTTATTYPSTEAEHYAKSYNILWWSDAQAIKDKIDLAKKLGIRGIAVFKLDGGEDPAFWNVLPPH
jgi:spore germination protein YaaH